MADVVAAPSGDKLVDAADLVDAVDLVDKDGVNNNKTPAKTKKPFYPPPNDCGRIFSREYIPNQTREDSEISRVGSELNGLLLKSNRNSLAQTEAG